MVTINYAFKEVICKIVYYGPGLSGKTTNLQYVFDKVPSNARGELISLETEADRTLYFDFLPINLGSIQGLATKFQLYTVPGQVFYNATRKLVLRGVDGLVFVADSQAAKMDENIESLNNLKENLIEYGYNFDEIPLVIQYNKRDLPSIEPIEHLQSVLNPKNTPYFEAVATRGLGVFDTLKSICKMVLDNAKEQSKMRDIGETTVARKEEHFDARPKVSQQNRETVKTVRNQSNRTKSGPGFKPGVTVMTDPSANKKKAISEEIAPTVDNREIDDLNTNSTGQGAVRKRMEKQITPTDADSHPTDFSEEINPDGKEQKTQPPPFIPGFERGEAKLGEDEKIDKRDTSNTAIDTDADYRTGRSSEGAIAGEPPPIQNENKEETSMNDTAVIKESLPPKSDNRRGKTNTDDKFEKAGDITGEGFDTVTSKNKIANGQKQNIRPNLEPKKNKRGGLFGWIRKLGGK